MWEKAINIICTNCFTEGSTTLLFPVLSYLNHNCWPNVSIEFYNNEQTWWGYLYAWNNIPKGTEVCISYIGFDDPKYRTARQERLNNWRFICKCHICTRGNGYMTLRSLLFRASQVDMISLYPYKIYFSFTIKLFLIIFLIIFLIMILLHIN